MSKTKAGVALAALALLTGACAPVQGTVKEKRYEPHIIVLIDGHDYGAPECWKLIMTTGSQVCVTKTQYDSVKVGEEWRG